METKKNIANFSDTDISNAVKAVKSDVDFAGMTKRQMKDLAESMKEARLMIKALKEKKAKSANVTSAYIRKQLDLSQSEFADIIGIKLSTLRNWEQGRVEVPVIAKTLFKVVLKNPKVLVEI